MTAKDIALWLGIAGSAAGVYFPIHSQIQSNANAEVQRAQDRQKSIDSLNQRFGYDEADIAYIKSQLPKDKQDVLNAIQQVRNQSAAQVQQAATSEQQDKSELENKVTDVQTVAERALRTAKVAADAPSERGPQ